jgi:electron transfer flavoprotein alpha subunit
MSVLIFLDQSEGHIRKNSFEAASYGAKVAELLGTSAEGIVFGKVNDDLPSLGTYGLKKIHTVSGDAVNNLDSQVFTSGLAQAVGMLASKVVVFANNLDGKSIAPRLSAKLKAGLVSGAVALPDISNGFVVKKNVFSGKAFAHVSISTEIKIISLNPNSYKINKTEGSAEVVELQGAYEEIV